MYFEDLMDAIKHELPEKIYHLNELQTGEPFVLSDKDIELVVDFAIAHQPQITLLPTQNTVDLLTLLMSMGTELPGNPNRDKFLGKKDQRIEECIIQRAIERIQSLENSTAHAAVFGLSGNPPTVNHLVYIKHLLTIHDDLHVVINAQSPLKDAQSYTAAETRLFMLKKMLEAEHLDGEHCKVERLEIDRDPPSRMIATLSLLVLMNANTKFTLILGLDGLMDFHKWYKWRQYGSLCDIKFYPREGLAMDVEKITASLQRLLDEYSCYSRL